MARRAEPEAPHACGGLSMSGYSLARMVGWAPVAGRSVFLDVRSDRYVEAKGSLHSAMVALLDGSELAPSDHKALEPAVADGLLIRTGTPFRLSIPEPSPTRSLLDASASPAGKPPLRLWRDIAQIRRRLQQGGLAELILELTPPEQGGAMPPADLHKQVMRFLGQRQWVPIAPKCLWDSLALVRFLARHDLPATLVFGVKLDPFAAHCWVQADGLLLTDSPDRVGAFTPLLAV